jgi:serine/threonine-protein kinase RsbW
MPVMASEPANSAYRFVIPSTLAGLRDGLNRLNEWLASSSLRQEIEDKANLIFEEIVTNIIRYAFDDRDEHPIEIEFRRDTDTLTFEFVDDGRPFDPRNSQRRSEPETLDSATIGGRGLFLVKNAAKGVNYERTNAGQNRLTIALARAGRA